jgi:hypothetical protein
MTMKNEQDYDQLKARAEAADDDGLTDADFAELVQELKKEGQA